MMAAVEPQDVTIIIMKRIKCGHFDTHLFGFTKFPHDGTTQVNIQKSRYSL
jgi:hypothetical protein